MFSKRCFSEWRVQSVCHHLQGQTAPKLLENSRVLRHFVVHLKGASSAGWQGQASEKHRLENTVWNPAARTCAVRPVFERW